MIESKVKELIIQRYGSVKSFADKIKVPFFIFK